MNDDTNDTPVSDGIDADKGKPTQPDLPPQFAVSRASEATRWDSGGRSRKWATIGCGLGIVVLIAALFAGSSLLRKTVWAGFAGTGQRLVANLPGDLPPGERMRLTRNLDRFTASVELQEDPYEAMGEFQKLARAALEDHRLTHDEVEEINLFLESQLAVSKLDVPYSMP